MSGKAKQMVIKLNPQLLEKLDSVAKAEHRNRSETIREAIRFYVAHHYRQEAEVILVRDRRKEIVRDA